MYTYELDVGLHIQDLDNYCGAACAQMIINHLKKNIIDQEELFNLGKVNNDRNIWGNPCSNFVKNHCGIDPTGLKYILDDKLDLMMKKYSIISNPLNYMLTVDIIDNLIKNGKPIPALVEEAKHWVLVRGIQVNGDLVQLKSYLRNNNSQAINNTVWGFWVNDPWPPYPEVALDDDYPEPHVENDACGRVFGCGDANQLIPGKDWIAMFSPVDFLGNGNPTCVALLVEPSIKNPKRINMSKVMGPVKLGIIHPDEVRVRVAKEVKAYGLDTKENIIESLADSTPGKPVLVQRLDMPDVYYYLVPFRKGRSVTAMAMMHAGDGKLGRFSAYPNPRKNYILSRSTMKKKITGKSIDLKGNKGKLIFRKGSFKMSSKLVWKPCMESMSPLYPFHVATIGGKQVYIGCNGAIYPELHDGKRFG